MSKRDPNQLQKLAHSAGFKSLASAGLLSLSTLRESVGADVASSEVEALHDAALQALDEALILEKSIQARASPLLPMAVKLGLKHPEVTLRDYEEWFGRTLSYANPGDVASMFSPAAYLTELYRAAKTLYNSDSRWHIDSRRADLANLALTQENLDVSVTALSLSNEILLQKARSNRARQGSLEVQSSLGADEGAIQEAPGDDEVLRALSEDVKSSGTPYHYHHQRLRQVSSQKDPEFKQLLRSPQVLKHLKGASLAGIYYDIPPALYELLVDEITEDKAKDKYNTYFGDIPAETMLNPVMLRNWFGITDAELSMFLNLSRQGDSDYVGNSLTTWLDNELVRLTLSDGYHPDYFDYVKLYPTDSDNARLSVKFTQNKTMDTFSVHAYEDALDSNKKVYYDSTDWRYDRPRNVDLSNIRESLGYTWPSTFHLRFFCTPIGSEGSDQSTVTVNVERFSQEAYLLKLNKAIRLYKATGLPVRELEDIVNSVDAGKVNGGTLDLLVKAALLMKRFNLSHEAAIVFSKGLISKSTHGGQLSQFDRLFNNPSLVEGGLTEDATISLKLNPAGALSEHAEIKATLKRAFGTDDEGLYELAATYILVDIDNDNIEINTTLLNLSGLYTLSLWSKVLGLTPQTMRQLMQMVGLPEILRDECRDIWVELFEKLNVTVNWLKAHGWSVQDLLLMTRDVTKIPVGTEITGLLNEMKVVVARTVAELEPDQTLSTNDYIRLLTPLMASTFGLSGDTAAKALLTWANLAKPGGAALEEVWADLKKEDQASTQSASFAYGLAQKALIIHGTHVSADALALFVEKPSALGAISVDAASTTLECTAFVVMALADFSDWLKSLPDSSGAGSSIISSLGTDTGVSPKRLALATGLPSIAISQAAQEAAKKKDVKDALKIGSWHEIDVIRQWVALANAFGVMPVNIGEMLKLDYVGGAKQNKAATAWSDWKSLADAFVGGLSLAQNALMESALQPAMSVALSGWLLSNDQTGYVLNLEEQNQYLLLDSLNGSQIMVSRIAQAISAQQQFIHRVLSLPSAQMLEGQEVQRKALDSPFFTQWETINSRYSTWAASKQLMFYPENYIDPTVRLGQTKAMDDMLQMLGQAQINTDTVGDAFLGYLSAFEEVANLETISGYHDNANIEDGKTWFIGRSRSDAREYWWRTLDEDKRDSGKATPANAWTGWEKITCSPQPFGELIRPVIYKKRLYLGWVERNEHVVKRDKEGVATHWEATWELKVAFLRYDGNWSVPVGYKFLNGKKSETEEHYGEQLESLLKDVGLANLSLYLSGWPSRQVMLAGIYKKEARPSGALTGELTISETLSFNQSVFSTNAPLQKLLAFQYDTPTASKVLLPFSGVFPQIENKLTDASKIPEGYEYFNVSGFSASVASSDDEGNKYKLIISFKVSVDVVRPKYENFGVRKLLKEYPTTLISTTSVYAALKYTDRTYLLHSEAGQLWCYMYHPDHPDAADYKYIREANGEQVEYIKFKIDGRSGLMARFKVNIPYLLGIFKYELVSDSGKVSSFLNFETFGLSDKIIALAGYSDLSIVPPRHITFRVVQDTADSGNWSDRIEEAHDFATGPGEAIFENVLTPNELIFINKDAAGNDKFENIVYFQVGFGSGKTRIYSLRVYKVVSDPGVDSIGTLATKGETAQYLTHGNVKTRLNTLFARQLTEKAVNGIDTILSYETQNLPEPPLAASQNGGVMDFTGANALYFWELFYYTPMMIMQRFLQEERYDLAEFWLKYVFNPAGYTVNGTYNPRMWNVRPLLLDTNWNEKPLESSDPDAVAQNDPMHYKLNAFMRLLDLTIGRGDLAYRKLERDTLAEAKVWYNRAYDLLGEAPWIDSGSAWQNPSLHETAATTVLVDRLDALALMAQREHIDVSEQPANAAIFGKTLFLPEANTVMLGYWEKLRIRLYNLRHNLTLDGQPLNLPLFASPADPKALLAAAVAAESGGESELPTVSEVPALRFTPLLEGARTMASQLIQFGNTMQGILERQDGEALAALLVTQGAELAASSVSLQKQTLAELGAERTTLKNQLEAVVLRRDHYKGLYDENINGMEIAALVLDSHAQLVGQGSKALYVAAGIAKTVPTIFGLANGGMQYAGPIHAAGLVIDIAAAAESLVASRLTLTAQYGRRREEWKIQYQSADKEMAMIQAQLELLTVRETSAGMQIAHMERQQAHATAQLALFHSKFAGKPMYSWLRSRLATVFYTYYDLTATRCMMAQSALQWEKNDTSTYLKTGTWTGAWAGLLCGEGLMLSLGQMENAWVRWQKRELEVTRIVSLAKFFEGKLKVKGNDVTLSEAIKALMKNTNVESPDSDNTVVFAEDANNAKQLAIHFDLNALNLAAEFSSSAGPKRVRSIAVTLPALLGPYQTVSARLWTDSDKLPAGCNECALSHGLQDTGLFAPDGGDSHPRWGAQWLPFEGLKVDEKALMTLTFPADTEEQVALLQSLNDAILHVQFTVR